MGQKTGISWTDATWNPVTGCTPVSAGCENCYAARWAKRVMGDFGIKFSLNTGNETGPRKFSEVMVHPDRLDIPLRWRKPRRIFVCSMGDLFHHDVPDKYIARVFQSMHQCQQHIFQVLTKRPERMREWINRCGNGGGLGWITHDNTPPARAYDGTGIIIGSSGHWPLANVWLGVTAENQAAADERIPLLLQTPAAVRFVSVEPMLGAINIQRSLGREYRRPSMTGSWFSAVPGSSEVRLIDWVICGGETGPGARPVHLDWVRSLRDQCQAARVPFHFKQWGEYCAPSQMPEATYRAWDCHHGTENCWDRDRSDQWRVGKRAAGRMLDGREWMEFPNQEDTK